MEILLHKPQVSVWKKGKQMWTKLMYKLKNKKRLQAIQNQYLIDEEVRQIYNHKASSSDYIWKTSLGWKQNPEQRVVSKGYAVDDGLFCDIQEV